MTITTGAQRAARAYKLALSTKDEAARMKEEFPRAAAKLEEAAKVLIAEGRSAEAAETVEIKT